MSKIIYYIYITLKLQPYLFLNLLHSVEFTRHNNRVTEVVYSYHETEVD